MLERKIYKDLLKWKDDRRNGLKKCLLIKGARQVGKSFIIKEFGKREYKSFINIDFYKNPNLKNIFEGDLSPDAIYKKITANMAHVQLIENDTLIFLDEIQYSGKARTAIKFLAEDSRYDVISSGSLLGLSYKEDGDPLVEEVISIPVGYETQLTLHSLDFEEFLLANGYSDEIINNLKEYLDYNETIPLVTHDTFERLVREYIVVGGMPEVVDDFVKNKDFNRVHKLQKGILDEYQDDISKHAKGREKQYVRMCYDAIPKQLSKEIKKFQYSTVEKGQTRRKYGGSVKWLIDSAIVNPSYNVHEPYLPLLGNCNEDQFKLYFHDTGLLCCIYGVETKLAILNNSLKGNAKGGIYENLIASALVKKGHNLYYFKPNENQEIEFLIERNGEIVPIEVKAKNGTTVSLNSFIDNFKPSIAYKLISGRNGKEGVKITLPHYMILFI